MQEYDYLYDYLDQIIEDPQLFDIWKNYPESDYEKQLSQLVQEFKK
jgi:hypothetical protein